MIKRSKGENSFSTKERVKMVEEMQESRLFKDIHLEHMEDRKVKELYDQWKELGKKSI